MLSNNFSIPLLNSTMNVFAQDTTALLPKQHSLHPPSYPASGRAWYAVVVLLVAYISSMIDRVVLGFLVAPIKQTFGVNDVAVSVLGGVAFTLFYTLVGLPAGWLADRVHRRNMAVAGVLLWSAATVYCGFAQSYTALFVGRVLVGVGEAVLGPVAYSLIADYFAPERRATALSAYSMGITLGTGLAVMLAGAAIALTKTSAEVAVPLLGAVRSWQYVFILVGVPGLAVALMLLTVQEPQRKGQSQYKSLRSAWGFMRLHWKTLVCHSVGFGFFSMVNQGVGFWLPEMFVRTFGWARGDIAQAQGLATALGGTLGLIAGARLTAWFRAQGKTDAALRTMLTAALGLLCTAVWVPLAPNGTVAAWLLAPMMFFGFSPYGAATSALQELMPNELRGQAGALFLLTINLVGGGAGPVVISVLTHSVFGADAALRYSIGIVTVASLCVASMLFSLGLAHFRQSLAASVQLEPNDS